MGKAWIITGGKGGVGASTFTAAVAMALGELNQPVAVVDGNIGYRTLDMLLGLENSILYDFFDFAAEDCSLDEALAYCLKMPMVALLPPPQFHEKEAFEKVRLSKLIALLKEKFTYVLVDCSTKNEDYFLDSLAGADEMILLSTADDLSLRASEKIVQWVWEKEKIKPYLVVNKINPKYIKEQTMLSPKTVSQLLDLPLLGAVVQDEKVVKASYTRNNVMDVSVLAAGAYRNIAKRLSGTEVSLEEDYEPKMSVLLKRFFKSEGSES